MRVLFILSVAFISVWVCPKKLAGSDCVSVTKDVKDLLYRYATLESSIVKKKIDSLRPEFHENCIMSNVYLNMIQGRLLIDEGDVEQAFTVLDEAFALVSSTENVTVKKDVVKLIASIYSNNNKQSKALELSEEAYQYPCHKDSIKCMESNVALVYNMGLYCSLMDQFNNSIAYYNLADSLIAEHDINNPLFVTAIQNALGNLYYGQMQDYNSAISSYKKALLHVPEDHRFRFSIMHNLALSYREVGAIDSSIIIANEIKESTELPNYLIGPYQLEGLIESDSRNYSAAIGKYTKALDYAMQSANQSKIAWCKYLLGEAYYFNSSYLLAEKYMNQARSHFMEGDLQSVSKIDLDKFSNLIAVAKVDPDLSQSILKYVNEYDSIFSQERIENMDELVHKYEKKLVSDSLIVAKARLRSKSLEVKVQRYGLIATLLGFILFAFLGRGLWLRYKESQSINETLVFEKTELSEINKALLERIEGISNPLLNARKLEIKSGGTTHFLEYDSVLYMQSEDNGTRVYTKDNSLWTDSKIKFLLGELPDNTFLQVYRSTIVNVNHITSIASNSLIVSNGTELKIGRTYKKEIKKIFSE